jgi:hypothetical protein
MLVEVQYHDEEGSVCPFCGLGLKVRPCTDFHNEENEDCSANMLHIHGGYEVRLYPCECSSGHMTFLAQQSEDGDKYDYTMRAFVHYQDWEEHIDMSITAGAHEIDLCDDEDDAWIIHREMDRQLKEGIKCQLPISKAASKALDRQQRFPRRPEK